MWVLQQHNTQSTACANTSCRLHPLKPSSHFPVTPLTDFWFPFSLDLLLLDFLDNETIGKALKYNRHLLSASSSWRRQQGGRAGPGAAGERGASSCQCRRESGQEKCYFPFFLYYQIILPVPALELTFLFFLRSVFSLLITNVGTLQHFSGSY